MSEENEALKNAKIQRRAAKASLTRLGKALTHLCESKRPANEVSEYLVKVKNAFENVVLKHEIYANLIVEDKLFEKEEQWLDECQNFFLKIDIDAKCYVEHVSAKVGEVNPSENEQHSSGMIGMQNADSASNTSHVVAEETQPSVSDEDNHVIDSSPAEISNESVNTPSVVQINLEQSPSQITSQSETLNMK